MFDSEISAGFVIREMVWFKLVEQQATDMDFSQWFEAFLLWPFQPSNRC